MTHALLDTNVLLDVWLRNDRGASAEVLAGAAEGLYLAYITPVILANSHYFLAQLDKAQAARRCDALLDIATVIDMPAMALRKAFRSGWTDTEDAMHCFAAQQHEAGITCIITRNTRHFRAAQGMEVLEPAAFRRKYLG